MDNICRVLGFEGCISIDADGKSRGLAMLWSQDVQLSLNSYSSRHIECDVIHTCFPKWHIMRVSKNLGKKIDIGCGIFLYTLVSHLYLHGFALETTMSCFTLKRNGDAPLIIFVKSKISKRLYNN